MKKLGRLLMKGLVALLPLGLTAYTVYWLITTTEALMHSLLLWIMPPTVYRPGMGLAAGLAILLTVGAGVNAYVVRRMQGWMDRLIGRIPIVKTVYGAIRDLMQLFPTSSDARDLRSVVVVRLGNIRVLGFITRDDLPELEALAGGTDLVAVYLPMSYQIGGLTIYLPKDQCEILDMPVETAMRMVITAGMSSGPVPARAAVPAPAA
jgi:uncharacterized membrane protein